MDIHIDRSIKDAGIAARPSEETQLSIIYLAEV